MSSLTGAASKSILFPPWWQNIRTFVRHPRSCFQVQLLAPCSSDLLDVVAQGVAAVLPAVQADTLDESTVVAAPVGHALLVFIQQRVHEQMDRALMSTFDRLFKACVMAEILDALLFR